MKCPLCDSEKTSCLMHYFCKSDNCAYNWYEDCEQKKSPWISVNDQTPEANNVLGYSEIGFLGDHYLECYYNSTQNKWYESRGSWQVDIIYWMPLPKTPTKPEET
jgi:hypothetical protein